MRFNGMRVAVLGAVTAVCCSGVAFAQQTSGSFSAEDKTFLKKSAEGSMTEINFAKLALTKTKNDEVRTFAQKMVEDHTKLIADMKPFAKQAGVTPPAGLNAEHKMERAKLAKLSGDAFDKEYVKMMSEDHHKDLQEFSAEESSTSNSDLKATVSQGKQVVQQHSDMIDQIAQKNGVPAAAGTM